ncbi:MAG: methyltransferase, partial [Campylobacterota bacterium]|nr:methyltransferase [Campylobacterota bacterium]
KRKGKGRFDGLGLWEDTKKKWLSNFINKKDEAGFSVNKVITADMEWVAEAYMETDYSDIENINFEDGILNYVTFLHKNKLIDKVNSNE